VPARACVSDNLSVAWITATFENVYEKDAFDQSRDRQGAVSPEKHFPLPHGRGSETTSHTRSEKVKAGLSRRFPLPKTYRLPIAGVMLAVFTGCRSSQLTLVDRIDVALLRSRDYLIAHQSPDGAWRSETYRILEDGTLTPHVLSTLYCLPRRADGVGDTLRKGQQYLLAVRLTSSRIPIEPPPNLRGLGPFPVYTASAATWVTRFESDEDFPQSAWLSNVRGYQFSDELGWTAEDLVFGGWGYFFAPPRKQDEGVSSDANISATVYALGALRSAGIPSTDPAFARAKIFVERCQNYSSDEDAADDCFDDGGFFFSPADAARNKAGCAGVDRTGRTRFHSYGSATADGVRALLMCGYGPDHPRVVAARQWLESNFDSGANPGAFEPDREVLRNAYYYYYAWSVAHALHRLGVEKVRSKSGSLRWDTALAEELLSRQRPVGSWSNRFTDGKEDDPLVATPFAAAALLICQLSIAGEKCPFFRFDSNATVAHAATR